MPYLINLAIEEGCNPGLYDSEYFFKADPNGFFVVFIDKKPAGCIAAINYGNGFGFIGFHIIKHEFRNNGIGKYLFEFAQQKLGDINIGLNCFENQVDYYNKLGFNYSNKIYTYEGIAEEKSFNMDSIITPFKYPFDMLYDYEKKIFPGERKFFLQSWFNQPKSLFLGVVDNDKYLGYGLFRPCINGYKISNLFCEDMKTAVALLNALIGHMPKDSHFFIDVPEPNVNAIKIAERMNFKKIKEIIRMYNKQEPSIDLNRIYGFTTLEIG